MKNFKKLLLCASLVCSFAYVTTGQVGINTDNTSPDPSAMLDIKSDAKGLLIPRLNSTQRQAIPSPALGLMVFDTDSQSFWFHNGSIWQEISLNTDNQQLTLSGTQLSIENGNSIELATIDTDTDDQNLTLSGTTLSIDDGNSVDLSSIDTDDQNLSFDGTNITIDNGNSIDISAIDTDTDTDDQNLTLSGTTLSIDDGNSVDLSSIDTDTDDQSLSFDGTNITIDNGNSIDISAVDTDTDTDDQNLTLSGTTLSIDDGNSVDLSSIDTDTDNQSLSFDGTNITIDNGNSIDISAIDTDTDTDDQNLTLSGTTLSIDDGNSVDLSSIDTDTDNQSLSFDGTNITIDNGNSIDISAIDTDTDTDDQNLTLSGTTLSIDDGNSVDLASIDTDTDNQTLSFDGTNIIIDNGNSIDISAIDTDTDTDDQNLTLSGTTLSIDDGNSVDLSSIDTDTDDQTLSVSGSQLTISQGNTVDLSGVSQDNDWTENGNNVYNTNGGNVGVGSNNPKAKVQVRQTGNELAMHVFGTYNPGASNTTVPAGPTMFFNSNKAAFRAGYADPLTGHWEDSNVGLHSVALGRGNTASGSNSVALGINSSASGNESFAAGALTEASGVRATALGYASKATAINAIALGQLSEATGQSTVAIGTVAKANGTNAIAMGFAPQANGNNSLALGSSIRVEGQSSVGIGLNNGGQVINDANVMAVMGGKVGINRTSPQARLDVNGSLRYTDGNQAAGYILTSDADGQANWMDPGTIVGDSDDQTLALSGTVLTIQDGNSVDLASIDTDTDTDDQNLSLSGTTLSIDDGNSIDLSSIDTDTDDQTLSLSGTTLTIDNGNSVDLASIDTDTDTDDQNLTLSGTTLGIDDGNSVDLSSIDTDDQNLSFAGTTLSIDNGNSVDLSSLSGGGTSWSSTGVDISNINSGNVGIGTTMPEDKLHINEGALRISSSIDAPTIDLVDDADGSKWRIAHQRSVDKLEFRRGNSTTMMKIMSDGKVQIGGGSTGVPSHKLEVDGDIRIDDGTAQANYVLTASDITGAATWKDPNSLIAETDDQNLTLTGTSLSIEGGNSVDLSPINATKDLIESASTKVQTTSTQINYTVDGQNTWRMRGYAFENSNPLSSTFIGNEAGSSISSGSHNVSLGNNTLQNLISGALNTALGSGALQNGEFCTQNVAIGYRAGRYVTFSSNNVFLGPNVANDPNITSLNNKLWIDNSNTTSPLIEGDFASNELKINGDLESTGKIVTNETIQSSSLNGLKFASSTGSPRMVIQDDGDVGIRTSNPQADLHVAGHFMQTNGDMDVQSVIRANSAAFGMQLQSRDGISRITIDDDGDIHIGENGNAITQMHKFNRFVTTFSVPANSYYTLIISGGGNLSRESAVTISPRDGLPNRIHVGHARVLSNGNIEVKFVNPGGTTRQVLGQYFYISVIQ